MQANTRLSQVITGKHTNMPDRPLTNEFSDQENVLHSLESEREQLARRNAFQSSLSSLFRKMENSKEIVPLLERIAQEIIVLLRADSAYMSDRKSVV